LTFHFPHLCLQVLLMVFITDCAPVTEEKISPSIIFIMADDLGYGDLGCYGQEIIQTPNIDRLASSGIRFTQHYAGNTVCAPSRGALMTGYHMGHAQVRGNLQAEPSGQWPISSGTTTVARLLKSAGYRTAMIGKWGLGIEHSTGDPLKQGFDFYYGYLDQVLAHNYYPEYLLRNGEREYLDNEVQYLDTSLWHRGLGSYSTRKSTYSHDLFQAEALRFLEENHGHQDGRKCRLNYGKIAGAGD
jgi:arylsulfatase A